MYNLIICDEKDGFLSENEHFAAALERNGIKFIGPTASNLHQFGDKSK